MAEPTGFDEANTIFGPPPGVSEDQIGSINAFRDGSQIVTCWRLTAEELAEVNRTGRIWLGIHGSGLPPHWISGATPFVSAEDGE